MGKTKKSQSYSKSSRRSSSAAASSKRSASLNSRYSLSSKSANTLKSDCSVESERKVRATNRIIYKGSESRFRFPFTKEDGLPMLFVSWLQAFQLIYCGVVTVYNYYRSINPVISFFLVVILWGEVFSLIVILANTIQKTLSFRTFGLVFQFFQFYMLLSVFVHIFDEAFADAPNRSISELTLNAGTMIFVACVTHFIILIASVNFVGNGRAQIDNSPRVILESTERRRNKMYAMVASLLREVCLDQIDTNIDLTITDETGNVVKLEGTEVKADSQKMVTMTMDPNKIEVKTINTTGASLELASDPPAPPPPQIQFVNRSGPLFNYVLEQDKALTPRTIV